MIEGRLITQNPFGLPALFWCEGRFSPFTETELAYTHDLLGPVHTRLLPDMNDAVPKRRSEFLVGRICAALALRAAGLPEVVGRRDRMPVWPDGGTGSISHTDTRVIATVSRNHAGVGVDCEDIMTNAQAQELHPMILTPTEASQRPDTLSFAAFLTLVFSAKEALYKALSFRLNRVLEFSEVMLIGFAPDRLHLCYDGETHDALYRIDTAECLTFVLVIR